MTPCRILIVEDEAIVAMDMEERLIAMGFEPAGRASSGAEALSLAERDRVDLVVMDIRLQGVMDGIETAMEMRRRFRLPVIFTTAYAEDGTLERAKLAEPFGYLLKPFDDRELKSVIEIARYRHRTEEEIRRLNRLYGVLSQVNQAVVRLQAREELLSTVCRVVVERGEIDLAWIGWLNPATSEITPVAQFGAPGERVKEAIFGVGDHPAGKGNCAKAVLEGRSTICNDCSSEACSYASSHAPAQLGFHSCAAFPLRFQGQVCGTLNLCVRARGFFQEREVQLLEEVAVDISFALDQAEAANRRTATEAALRQSEHRYHRLFDEATEGIALADADTGEIVDCNAAFFDLTGYQKAELLGKPQRILHPAEATSLPVSTTLAQHRTDAQGQVLGSLLVTKDGAVKQVEIKANVVELGGRRLLQGFFRDVTTKLRYEREREHTLTLLRLLNHPNQAHELIENVTAYLQEWTGCQAVGVRLREGDDFPYFETRGLPPTFIRGESSLCMRDVAGQPIRDAGGNPILECMCGNVLCDRFDPAQPFFTAKGSFWTNSTTRLLATTTDAERQTRTRNRCHAQGYESVALIPLRHGITTLGLIQLADPAPGRFTPELLIFLEHAADHIALGLAQRQTYVALQASERKFRSLVETISDWVWEVDAHGTFTYTSPRVWDLLGYAPEEVVGRTPFDFMPQHEALRVKEFFVMRATDGPSLVAFENIHLHRDGREVVLETTAAPMFGPDGRFTGYRGSGRNITERKLAEAATQERLWAEERLSRLAGAAPGVMYTFRLRADGSVSLPYASPAVEQIFGVRPEDLTDGASIVFRLIHPEDISRVRQSIQDSAQKQSPWQDEFRVRHPLRGEIWIEGRSVPEREPDGSTLWHGFAHDITVRKVAEQALRDSEERSRELARESAIMAEIGRIVSSTLNIDEVYERFAQEVKQLVPFDRMVINTIDSDKGLVRNVYITGDVLGDRNVTDVYPLHGSGNAEMVRTQSTVLIQTEDFSAYEGRYPMLASTFRAGFRSILNVPLFSKGGIIGGLLLRSRTAHVYTGEAVACAERIATLIAGAIANAQLYAARVAAEEARRWSEEALAVHAQQLEAIRTISIEITRELDLAALLHLIVERAVQLVDAASGTCFLWDETSETLVPNAWIGYGAWRMEARLRLGEGLAGQVAQRREGVSTRNYATEAYAVPDIVSHTQARAVMGEPLLYHNQLIGVLVIDHVAAGRAFTSQDQALLRLLAAHAAIAIGNARLFAERERAAREARSLYEVAHTLTTSLDPLEILQVIAEKTTELLGTPHAQVVLWDEAAQSLRLGAAHGTEADFARVQVFRVGVGVNGIVAESRAPLVVNDYQSFPQRVPELPQVVADMGVPLLYQGRFLGVLNTHTMQPGRAFTKEHVALLTSFAAQAAIALENARLFREAQQAMEDIHRAQAELIRAETLRAVGQMAAGIAHDLNNTLAAMLGQIELQKLRALDGAVREGLTLLETAALDGAHIVQRLLNFARPKGTTSLGPCDLAAIVRDAVELTRPRWKDEPERRGRTIGVTLDLPTGLPAILGHAAELREAIANLIFNATDAMPQGGTLTVTGGTESDTVTLAVQDTGIGMSPDVQAHLFEPFFTTKGPRGTGLGLAGVYGIVERHGGRIAVASTVGQGTMFTLTFRRASGDRREQDAPATARQMVARRVLVVDDEALVRTTLVALLRAIGHTVTEAPDGATALRILAEAAPDVVFTDLGMPDMNGWEVARAVKARRPSLPVVLLTGWQDQAPVEEANRQAVDVILGKPARLEALRTAVADLTADMPA